MKYEQSKLKTKRISKLRTSSKTKLKSKLKSKRISKLRTSSKTKSKSKLKSKRISKPRTSSKTNIELENLYKNISLIYNIYVLFHVKNTKSRIKTINKKFKRDITKILSEIKDDINKYKNVFLKFGNSNDGIDKSQQINNSIKTSSFIFININDEYSKIKNEIHQHLEIKSISIPICLMISTLFLIRLLYMIFNENYLNNLKISILVNGNISYVNLIELYNSLIYEIKTFTNWRSDINDNILDIFIQLHDNKLVDYKIQDVTKYDINNYNTPFLLGYNLNPETYFSLSNNSDEQIRKIEKNRTCLTGQMSHMIVVINVEYYSNILRERYYKISYYDQYNINENYMYIYENNIKYLNDNGHLCNYLKIKK